MPATKGTQPDRRGSRVGALRRPLVAWVGAAALGLGVFITAIVTYFARDQSWERISAVGIIRLGYAIEAPYAYVDDTGRVTGEGPETARRVASALGLAEPVWVLTDFGDLIPALEAGRVDGIAAGLFITEERRQSIAFSRPTARVRPGLLVTKGNPHRLHAYADAVSRPGLRIAALQGSVEQPALLAAGLPAERLVAVPDAITGLELLRAGTIGGLALSAPTVRWMSAEPANASWSEVAHPFGQAGPGTAPTNEVAFAFRPRDRRLLRRWDAALASYMAGDEYPRIAQTYGFEVIPVTEERP